jgi:anti-sigma regulatory factor (Ser/Thr protein kinase)
VSTATTTARAYEHVFPGEPEQVAHARHDVARYLDGHPLTDDAVLIVSELATNAIRFCTRAATDNLSLCARNCSPATCGSKSKT